MPAADHLLPLVFSYRCFPDRPLRHFVESDRHCQNSCFLLYHCSHLAQPRQIPSSCHPSAPKAVLQFQIHQATFQDLPSPRQTGYHPVYHLTLRELRNLQSCCRLKCFHRKHRMTSPTCEVPVRRQMCRLRHFRLQLDLKYSVLRRNSGAKNRLG